MSFFEPKKNFVSVLGNVLCWLFVLYLTCVLVLAVPVSAKGRICTKLTYQTKVVPGQATKYCNQSYQAYCGWFTRKMCTFYEMVECAGTVNTTKNITIPKIVYVCCPGWVQLSNQSCIREEDARLFNKDNTTKIHIVYEGILPGDPEKHSEVFEEEEGGDMFGLSHGALAAIACGGLFMMCVTIVIGIHCQKRQKRLNKKAQSSETFTMEKQKMMTA